MTPPCWIFTKNSKFKNSVWKYEVISTTFKKVTWKNVFLKIFFHLTGAYIGQTPEIWRILIVAWVWRKLFLNQTFFSSKFDHGFNGTGPTPQKILVFEKIGFFLFWWRHQKSGKTKNTTKWRHLVGFSQKIQKIFPCPISCLCENMKSFAWFRQKLYRFFILMTSSKIRQN